MGTTVLALTPHAAPGGAAQRVGVWAPRLTLALFVAPVAAGLIGTLAPAFGLLSVLGGTRLSWQPWRTLFEQPGVLTSIRLSLQIGVLATVLSLAIAAALGAWAGRSPLARSGSVLVWPMNAAPHVAVAIGVAFLIAPSGWLARWLALALTGWDRPPEGLVTVRDPQGWAMVAALVAKEVPYLMLMLAAALNQVPHRELLRSAASLGYAPATAWFKLVYPRLHGQMRLPLYAVLAYSMSSVDVALILAPGNPPPLSVLAARWFANDDLQRYYPAAAAAVLQVALFAGALAALRVTESALAGLGRRWCERGGRRGWVEPLAAAAAAAGAVVLGLGLASLAVMAVWSVAVSWRYPRLLPDGWSLAIWLRQGPGMAAAFGTTLGLALSTSAVALAAAVACLEGERYTRRGLTGRALWLVYTPLLVPQIAFLYGFQVVLVRCGWDGGWLAVAWAHLVFVLPYVWLSLADPWRALDPRYARSAAALGVSPWPALWRLQLPLLLKPLCVAYAVGCAVSVGLYLPTLFAGAGRVTTLATEAVALSSGGDRRVVGVYTFALAALPLAVYGTALALPALRRRRRAGPR